jgi:hypothetical protein
LLEVVILRYVKEIMMTDLLLIFPPQWSPFQPALSLPSLSAWLKHAGFTVSSVDLNIIFFYWLFSDECSQILLHQLDEKDWSETKKLGFRTILSSVSEFRSDLSHLKKSRHEGTHVSASDYVKRHYIADHSANTYLATVSAIAEDFRVTPYEFTLKGGNLDGSLLERMVISPPPLLQKFVEVAITEHILPHRPKVIGISCLGLDQLYFTFLLGSLLKKYCDYPIIVGGTVLPRIFDRGALKPKWFSSFFDIVVRNEGEKPCEKMLGNINSNRPISEDVPGIIYLGQSEVVSSKPARPLNAAELPYPDFSDLPLENYFSADITLPLLSSRGCYWGKCEFCHHGMVYGEKYGAYGIEQVLETVKYLASRYNVKHFAFNDEAIPPKILRAMGKIFPKYDVSGWNFTGLIKFENYFQKSDFENLADIGFRSIYVGLESASERVLELMKKNNKQETIVKNLTDATAAGIWMHCFLFFGFPGETDKDAQETYDFVLSNSDIIGSFGSATFVLEHNAPIFHHLNDFGLQISQSAQNDVDVYYDYILSDGITPKRALYWMNKLNNAALSIPKYQAIGWVPREHLLSLLSMIEPGELTELGLSIRNSDGLPSNAKLAELTSIYRNPSEKDCWIVINRLNQRVMSTTGSAATLTKLFYEHEFTLNEIGRHFPPLLSHLAFPKGTQNLDTDLPASVTLRMQ